MGNSCCNQPVPNDDSPGKKEELAPEPPDSKLAPTINIKEATGAERPARVVSLQQASSPSAPPQVPPVTIPVNKVAEAPVRTLSQDDPTMAARHAAYQARKDKRQQKLKQAAGLATGDQGGLTTQQFLSGLPEVESDIRYRFNFVVVGTASKSVIEAACESSAAKSLPGAISLANSKDEEDTFVAVDSLKSGDSATMMPSPRSRRRGQKNKTYRCLCKVVDPFKEALLKAKDEKERPLLAKMVLRPIPPYEDVPICSTHLEALSTVIVFVLQVDNKQESVDDQLTMIHQAIQRMRARTRSKLRPVRAILLCQASDDGQGAQEQEWGAKLSEFEQNYGKVWQFGPINMDDGNTLQATFGEMASVRIKQNETGEGTQAYQEDDDDVLLLESELEQQDPELAEKYAEEVLHSARSRSSETSSTISEGAHRPPIFEAEYEGSLCSESALELHQRLFGLEDMDRAASDRSKGDT